MTILKPDIFAVYNQYIDVYSTEDSWIKIVEKKFLNDAEEYAYNECKVDRVAILFLLRMFKVVH